MATARETQLKKRRDLFLRGPILFGWIAENIPDAASRLILVAQGFMGMHSPPLRSIELRLKIWDCANIVGKDRRSRVLAKIDTKVSGYRIERKVGGVSILHRLGD